MQKLKAILIEENSYLCPWCGKLTSNSNGKCIKCGNGLDFENPITEFEFKKPRRSCDECFHRQVCSSFVETFNPCDLWDGWHNIAIYSRDTPVKMATVVIMTDLKKVYTAQMNHDGAFIIFDAPNGIEGKIERWRYI